MVFPDSSISAPPEPDMPEDIKADYLEAASIYSRSPRGAAALLRLAIQKLCKFLGEPGKDINDDVRSLAAKGTLPQQIIQLLDTVRITGNNAVHPGKMNDEDFDHVASKLFDLVNIIVRRAITEPKELDALYQKLPEGPRKAAEEKDARARQAKQ